MTPSSAIEALLLKLPMALKLPMVLGKRRWGTVAWILPVMCLGMMCLGMICLGVGCKRRVPAEKSKPGIRAPAATAPVATAPGMGSPGPAALPPSALPNMAAGTTPTPPGATRTTVKFLHPAAPGSFAKLVRRHRSSIVHLRAPAAVRGGPAHWLGASVPAVAPKDSSPLRNQIQQAAGSGVIIDREGSVVTSARVVGRHVALRATLHDGTEISARVIGLDRTLDLALLRLAPGIERRLKPLRFGDSQRLEVGEWLVALANPFGWGIHASAGIVSALPPRNLPLGADKRWGAIQTTLPINPGNDGAAVLNLAGELVGLAHDAKADIAGVGFVLPADVLAQAVLLLRQNKRLSRVFLGIYVKPLDDATRRAKRAPKDRGVLVSGVKRGGPAHRAKLRAGDIILTLDGKAVSDPRDLMWAAHMAGAKRLLKVTGLRAGRPITLALRPQEIQE